MGQWVRLQAKDGHELDAYRSAPTGAKLGSVVVLQEIFGVNAHIRSVADRLAEAGFAAIAPALFDRTGRGVELRYGGVDMGQALDLMGKLDPTTALLDVAAAAAEVGTEQAPAAVVGFCYGGFLSWLGATRGLLIGFRPACCVGYYAGGIGKVAAEIPGCPVMLHFGGADSHIGTEQIEAVRTAHPDVPVYVYEGAGHAFNRDVDPASFHAEAAALAWRRTLDFLEQNVA